MITLDDLDRRILHQLQRDASLSNAELAERVGSTGPSCWRRIRQMEDAGLLVANVRLADPDVLGQNVTVFCHVRMKSHEEHHSKTFTHFVREEERIMECYSMSGDWDFLLRVVAESVADYEKFLMGSLLKHAAVASASSQFALSVTKYQTALPVR